MKPLIIGISSGLIIMLLFAILKQFDKKVIYGLILTAIGFLYVGFAWTDLQAFIVNSVQSVFFLLLAYYGIKKSLYILAAGFFLHGSWDLYTICLLTQTCFHRITTCFVSLLISPWVFTCYGFNTEL